MLARRLIEQEKKLEIYRRRTPASCRRSSSSNLQAIQNIQMQIQSVVESLNRDRDQRLVLQRQLADAEAATGPEPAAVRATDFRRRGGGGRHGCRASSRTRGRS